MDKLLEVNNVCVLSDSSAVTFDVEAGDIVCLFGMNGSGKTLLLKSICGIYKQLSGEITKHIATKDVGVCLQFPEHLVFKSTTIDEAEQITGSKDKAEKLLDDLSIMGDSSPFFLSDGEKRLLFLYGYLENRALCLFDEPFASLDEKTKQKVGKKIKSTSDTGTAIIYTANRKADIAYATKVIEIKRD